MRRIRVIDHDGMNFRHEGFMQDPELREAYECGVKEGWRQAMEETYGGGYGHRDYGRGGMGSRRMDFREQPDRQWRDDDDPYMERRHRDSRGRFM